MGFNAIHGEEFLYVTRTSSSRAFTSNPVGKRYVVTGPCGAGKSTYALVSYAQWFQSLLVIQPDNFAVSNAVRQIDAAKKNMGVRTTIRVVGARQASSILRSKPVAYDAVWVDEVHTIDGAIVAVVKKVRDKYATYVMATATVSSAASGHGVVVNSSIVNDDVSYANTAKVIKDDTVWHPSRWGGKSRVIVYAASTSHLDVIRSYYKRILVPHLVVTRSMTVNQVDNILVKYDAHHGKIVLIVGPGVGAGITSTAEILIDSGYTADVVSDRDVTYYRSRPLTEVEAVQRHARVGRNSTGIVISPETTGLSPKQSVDKLGNTLCNRAFDVNDELSTISVFDQVDHGDLDALLGDTDVVHMLGGVNDLGRRTKAVKLFTTRIASFPAVHLDLTQTNGWRKIAFFKSCPQDSAMTFDEAKGKYNDTPWLFTHAVIRHCGSSMTKLESLMNNGVIVDVIAQHIVRSAGAVIKGNGDFARNVAWLLTLRRTVVAHQYSSILLGTLCKLQPRSGRSRAVVASTNGYQKEPGTMKDYVPGPKSIASRLFGWSNSKNLYVAMCKYKYDKPPSISTWAALDAAHKERSLDAKCVLAHPTVLVVHVGVINRLPVEGDTIVSGDWTGVVEVLGFDMYTMKFTSGISWGEGVIMMSVRGNVDTKPYSVPTINCVGPGMVRLDDVNQQTSIVRHVKPVLGAARSDMSHVWRFAANNNLPVILTVNKVPTYRTWEELSLSWQSIIKMKSKPHLSHCTLIVHISEDVGDGKIIRSDESRYFSVIGTTITDRISLEEFSVDVEYSSRAGVVYRHTVRLDVDGRSYSDVSSWARSVGDSDKDAGVHDYNMSEDIDIVGSSISGDDQDHCYLNGDRVGEADNPGPVCCNAINRLYVVAYRQGLTGSCAKKTDSQVLHDGISELFHGAGKRVKFGSRKNLLTCKRIGQPGFNLNLNSRKSCRRCVSILYRAGLTLLMLSVLLCTILHDWKLGTCLGQAKNPGPDNDTGAGEERATSGSASMRGQSGDDGVRDVEQISNIGPVQDRSNGNMDVSMDLINVRAPPSVLNAVITTFGSGGDFSPLEREKISQIENTFEEGSYLVNLTHFAITSDGSNSLSGREGANLRNRAGGNTTTTWMTIFTQMRGAVGTDRFTVRKYLRMKAALLVETYFAAPVFMRLFNDGQLSAISKKQEVFAKAIYTTSWASHLAKNDDRANVAKINRSRDILVQGGFSGDVSQFAKREESVSAGPPKVDHVNFPMD